MMRNTRHKIGAEKILKGCGGFSLLEIMLVLFVISVLSAVMAPLVFQFVDDRRETATRQEIETVQRAIFGKPSVGQYGYVGDMGGLPSTLADLNTKPGGADDYTSSGRVNGIGIGWNGPYLNIGYSTNDYLTDTWGRNYTYDNVTGQLTSLGSDGAASTNDDIVIPPYPADTTGNLSVTVKVYDSDPGILRSVDDSWAAVDVYYASTGTQAMLDDIPWNVTDEVFEVTTGLHQGVHAVKVTGVAGDCSGLTAKANAVVLQGTTSLTVFLGTCNPS